MKLPQTMRAMVLEAAQTSLVQKDLPLPVASDEQVLIKVIACGVCRTDLHIVDGELMHPKLPLIPGHEIIGTVVQKGPNVHALKEGDVVGVPWLAHTCGKCRYCLQQKENLCEDALFTGYTVNGGYATFTVAYADYCIPLEDTLANASAAPLLCAGLIGYRSYSMIAPSAVNIGIYGFGAAAHILTQLAVAQQKNIYAFTRDGDESGQQFARSLGAVWAGNSSATPPVKLDASILFAPAGSLIPKALEHTGKGGSVICGGIHMSNIPSFPYSLLWEERKVMSVANLTRQDGQNFFDAITHVDIRTTTKCYPLEQANEALSDLKNGKLKGAAVLVMI
ncbi:zinc-dependent alcohol dehydrogenase family protein [Danxiaibacter flavus]|uniref:Zinc-dependent alcohol dehydrogenase family protein n=1 Tax=Danxiaibacter flavus TaxID=3049108 RepID=A0ABV3ZK48_9BACT|nr:zinc-dependent alcohol dehydrogenase family protein [Chitinophagaceae bacterium DXS]